MEWYIPNVEYDYFCLETYGYWLREEALGTYLIGSVHVYAKCACLFRIPSETGVIGVCGSHDVGPGT